MNYFPSLCLVYSGYAYVMILRGLLSHLSKGVYGAYFSKLNYRWSRNVRNKTWLKAHPVLEVLLVGQ